jgi:colanic acid biosynthesis glycosyl transferase WcaI
MKILFLTQWFEPEPTLKGLIFAKALAERGHHVEVLTGFPNYPGGRLYPGYRVRSLQREVLDGIPVTRVALYPSHDRSAVGRTANYASFAVSASAAGAVLIQRPDVVYAYHPPATIALPAVVIKAIRRTPFVLDIQDMWPDTLHATGMIENKSLLRLVGRFCWLGYRSAARITVSSPGFKDTLIDRGVPRKKIDVIYNWCDESAITTTDPDAPILKEAAVEGRFNVVFAGTMGHAQALSSVLQAASLVAERAPKVQFVFVGGGIQLGALKAEAEQRALSNVRFLPVRPAVEVGPLLAAADILLVHLRDDPLFAITIPSKTQAYMAAGRPILMAVRGDAAAVVHDAGAGVCVPPEDPDALATAVCELSSRPPDELTQMGARGRARYLQHFSFSAGVDRFEQVFQALSVSPLLSV